MRHFMLVLELTARKMSKYGVFSSPNFPVFGLEYGEILHISPYLVQMRENTDQKKLRIWTFFAQ